MKFVLCIKNSVLNIKNALCIKTLSSLYFPLPDLIHGSSFRRLFRENKVPRTGDRFSTFPVLWGFLFVDPICKLHSLTHSVLKKYLFLLICQWLHWVFVAALGFSLVAAHGLLTVVIFLVATRLQYTAGV